jgi:type IV/VI secretion system ImpK/VasF family protein
MKDVHWEAVHETFTAMEKLLGDLQTLRDASSGPEEAGKGLDAAAEAEDTLVRVRGQVRDQLDILRSRLSETLSERDVYLVLFPIVAYCDECVQTRYLKAHQLSWPPLQKELFQIQDAGELFYETVDDLLMKPNTLPFIHEVFYFCLKSGFMGRYENNPTRRGEYMERLQMKIPVASTEFAPTAPPPLISLEKTRSPYWYYAGSGLVLMLVYLLLLAVGRIWDPMR